jgi:16S rRNA (guanine966-N2)-methyltransferase
MRIISGKYKGKVIDGFNIDGTRPTMDRVKESVFSIIQSCVKDSISLDLFAGSGSLGIEALSNGAKECYFIDKNIEVIKILKKNLVGVDNAFVVNSSFDNFLKITDKKFDLIFLDPPYKLNLINKCIDLIIERDLLNEG